MADFTSTPEDMASLVAELQAAGAAAQQLEQQKNAATDFRRQFDCAPGALSLVVGHNGQRLREIEASTGAKVRCAQDPGRRRIPAGARVLIEGPTRDSVESAAALVESSLELAKSPQQIVIPRSALGRVIGRNGERIKSVKERSGAEMRVQQDVDPCFVEIASDDPMTLQVAREMVLSFMENGMTGTWNLEDECRAKAAASLTPHLAGAFAGLSSPLDPARHALAHQPVGAHNQLPQMTVDPYRFADQAWASTADATGRVYYYNTLTGQSTWECPPGFVQAPAYPQAPA
jgi:rRNA processing protein Krr1/Pno1